MRALFVDDEVEFLDLMHKRLTRRGMEVVTAPDGKTALDLLEASLQPGGAAFQVVVMDVRMPGMDGIEATRQISALRHRFAADGTQSEVTHTKVIILTTFDLDEYVMAAITAGASGFLLKDTEPETLLNSIRTVFQGNAIIAPSATKRLIEKMMEGDFMAANVGRPENSATTSTTDSTYTDPELDDLTDREREIVTLRYGLGGRMPRTQREIAKKLGISRSYVSRIEKRALEKLEEAIGERG